MCAKPPAKLYFITEIPLSFPLLLVYYFYEQMQTSSDANNLHHHHYHHCSLPPEIKQKKLNITNLKEKSICHRPASSVAKRTLSVREVWGSIPRLVKLAQRRQWLAITATFLRSCVAQALSCGNESRHSLHASA